MEFIDFAMRNWFLFALAFVLIGALLGTEVMHRLSGIKNLTPPQLIQLMNHDDPLLIDVRGDTEFRSGHIANARHIPLSELKGRTKKLNKFKNKPTVVYCNTGAQSGSAAKILKKDGFTTVNNLGGGIRAWQAANLPISKNSKKNKAIS